MCTGSHSPIIGGNKTGNFVCRHGIDLALAYQVSVSVALAVCYPIAEQSLRQVGKNELSRKLCTHLRNAGTRGNALVLASRQRKCKKGKIKIAAVVYVTAPLVRLDYSLHKIRPSFRPQSRSVQGNLMPNFSAWRDAHRNAVAAVYEWYWKYSSSWWM